MESNKKVIEPLSGKKILLGITGGIAAYKAANICSILKKKGSDVYPVLTPNAEKFINPITLSVLSGNKTVTDMFDNHEKVYHISLPQSCDIILIAPASANTISKIANGICDNFLTTSILASACPVLIAPAMNKNMWTNPIMQTNIEKLRQYGRYFFSGPGTGMLACGTEGTGRMQKEDTIIENMERLIFFKNDLKGKKVLVTAGGTRENIDSVRYISNYSSGKMGYEIAMEAVFRGAEEVVLVTAAKDSAKIFKGKTVIVDSTAEMKEKTLEFFKDADIVVMAAAVSDIIPQKRFGYKLKKKNELLENLKFKENENILEIISSKKKKNQIIVGFAAESSQNIENAIEKIKKRNTDFIVLNDISRNDIGFESDFNEITIIDKNGNMEEIPRKEKRLIAREIFNYILK
ncbi:MAG: bifunctional phosphopantothenoylcysteine decarboxylase/phosphopantothenate--cysteine ligase CoaBC [Actinomycetota bacterium]|nr:bifunctional phosphopantothenoylcysteine decarboxylase/phosphopantothenate--cysteine ligase CoaBC [Actinomycetota bacterium]